MGIITGEEAYLKGFDKGTWKLDMSRIITVVWGEKNGEIYIGLVLEARPHAIDSAVFPKDAKFWGVPRGFRKPTETPELAARREAGEESGATVVLESKEAGSIYPNPTFCATSGPLIFLKVDLDRLEKIRPERGEKIYKAKFFRTNVVKAMICQRRIGVEDALMEDGVSLAALAKFFAYLDLGLFLL